MVPTGEIHFASAYPSLLEGLGAMVSFPMIAVGFCLWQYRQLAGMTSTQ